MRITGFEGKGDVGGGALSATELDVGRETGRVGSTASVDVEIADHFGAAELQAVNGAALFLPAVGLDGGNGPLSTRFGGGGIKVEFVGLLRDRDRSHNTDVFKGLNR